MVTLFITAFAIVLIVGAGFVFWRTSVPDNSESVLPPNPDFAGLFGDHTTDSEEERKLLALAARQEETAAIVARARAGERSALSDANETGDNRLYDQVLNELVEQADSGSKLLSLMSHVAQHDLPVNAALVSAVVAAWKKSPDRAGTAKALHFAALSDDAGLYRQTVEDAIELRREGKLMDVLPAELRALFDGEFWILSSRTRSSGAGFVLKRTLENARRELEAASGRSPRVSKGAQPKEGPP